VPRAERRGRIHNALHRNPATAVATKTIVTVIGLSVLVAGLIMMVTPGPGLVALVLGLAILSTEWDWADGLLGAARRALERSREKAASIDPATRRRIVLWWVIGVLGVVALVVVLVWTLGWPTFVVHLWHWLQRRVGWLPDLPGS
jgi:uncharacterized protein (TIGR02611 family)